MGLAQKISHETISTCIEKFYGKAFQDPIIGHFFFGRDQQDLINKQIAFSLYLLGDRKTPYQGKNLAAVHRPLKIRPPHFRRRQILMAETLSELNVPEDLAQQWLDKEAQFFHMIVNQS